MYVLVLVVSWSKFAGFIFQNYAAGSIATRALSPDGRRDAQRDCAVWYYAARTRWIGKMYNYVAVFHNTSTSNFTEMCAQLCGPWYFVIVQSLFQVIKLSWGLFLLMFGKTVVCIHMKVVLPQINLVFSVLWLHANIERAKRKILRHIYVTNVVYK